MHNPHTDSGFNLWCCICLREDSGDLSAIGEILRWFWVWYLTATRHCRFRVWHLTTTGWVGVDSFFHPRYAMLQVLRALNQKSSNIKHQNNVNKYTSSSEFDISQLLGTAGSEFDVSQLPSTAGGLFDCLVWASSCPVGIYIQPKFSG